MVCYVIQWHGFYLKTQVLNVYMVTFTSRYLDRKVLNIVR